MPTTDDLDAKIRMLMASLVDTSPPAPPWERIEHRLGQTRRPPMRAPQRRIVLPMTLALLGILAFLVWPSRGPNVVSEDGLGFQITSYSAQPPPPGPPHLVNEALRFGYLPPGFHLLRSSEVNRPAAPYRYLQGATFGSGSKPFERTLNVSVVQAASFYRPLRPPATASRGLIESKATIHGHAAYVWVDHGASGGASVMVSWIDTPGFVVTVTGQSAPTQSASWLSVALVKEVANGLTFDPDDHNCVRHGAPLSSGSCAAGLISSPPQGGVPTGNTVLASGLVRGNPWILSGGTENGSTNIALNYEGAVLTEESAGNAPEGYVLDTATGLDGERFLIAWAPAQITSVEVRSAAGVDLSAKALPRRLDGHTTFILALGRVGGTCAELCRGPVTVVQHVGTQTVQTTDLHQGEGYAGTLDSP
jgi:hypothetical protein